MKISDILSVEWIPTIGCTEPAAIAFAAASAKELIGIAPESIHLSVDPRTYKNCFSVGIPRTDGKTGILWAVAIGANLPPDAIKDQLQCFKHTNADSIRNAELLIKGNRIKIDINTSNELLIDCTVISKNHRARSVIKENHSNIVKRELDGRPYAVPGTDHVLPSQPLPFDLLTDKKGIRKSKSNLSASDIRSTISKLSIGEIIKISEDLSEQDREVLSLGMNANYAIAEYGLDRFPKHFIENNSKDIESKLATLVAAGVYARMWGAEKQVYAAAGSGNKGIVCAVPIYGYCKDKNYSVKQAEEALSLAILLTSLTTHHLGPLSAACGCSNAAGVGLAAAIVKLEGGKEKEIFGAINNMVGNITGMICDGAKIGCALKTMTSVDAAFRSSSLALAGIHIPYEDGIIGSDGFTSLENVGRIANKGMNLVDQEILKIMDEKLKNNH